MAACECANAVCTLDSARQCAPTHPHPSRAPGPRRRFSCSAAAGHPRRVARMAWRRSNEGREEKRALRGAQGRAACCREARQAHLATVYRVGLRASRLSSRWVSESNEAKPTRPPRDLVLHDHLFTSPSNTAFYPLLGGPKRAYASHYSPREAAAWSLHVVTSANRRTSSQSQTRTINHRLCTPPQELL